MYENYIIARLVTPSYLVLLNLLCYIHCFIAVVCGAVGVSVVRESTQGIAAGGKHDEEMSLPQLTQEGKLSSALLYFVDL